MTPKSHGGRAGSRTKRLKGCAYPDSICDEFCLNWEICRTLRAERTALTSKFRVMRQNYNELATRFEASTPCDFCRYVHTVPDDEPCRSCPAEAREPRE